MYKLEFYVPQADLESVKQALFDAGAGRIGDYDCCAWECPGRGQYRPLAGSNPAIGKQGRIERVDEYKVEMVCADDCLQEVIRALIRHHPYEQPAWQAWVVQGNGDIVDGGGTG